VKTIYVECKPDKVVAKIIFEKIGLKTKIIHETGKSRVVKKLLNQENTIGVIDEDPTSIQPAGLEKFKLKHEDKRFNYKILQTKNNSKLIMLVPRLEEWIIKLSKQTKIDLKKFNLPNDPTQLHRIINTKTINLEKYLSKLTTSLSLI